MEYMLAYRHVRLHVQNMVPYMVPYMVPHARTHARTHVHTYMPPRSAMRRASRVRSSRCFALPAWAWSRSALAGRPAVIQTCRTSSSGATRRAPQTSSSSSITATAAACTCCPMGRPSTARGTWTTAEPELSLHTIVADRAVDVASAAMHAQAHTRGCQLEEGKAATRTTEHATSRPAIGCEGCRGSAGKAAAHSKQARGSNQISSAPNHDEGECSGFLFLLCHYASQSFGAPVAHTGTQSRSEARRALVPMSIDGQHGRRGVRSGGGCSR